MKVWTSWVNASSTIFHIMLPDQRRSAYFGNLQLPADPLATVGVLKGKSNFQPWHTAIESVLLSNPYSSALILGAWTEPQNSTSFTAEEQALFDEGRREWHAANTGTCRFIRETLAVNVIPFVRQYHNAKALYYNLVWLYGDEAGIDTQGGPPVPINAHTMNAKRGRASLLAALDAKRTLDSIPLVGVAVTSPSPSPTTPTSTYTTYTTSSSSSSTDGASTQQKFEMLRPTVTQEPTPEQHTTLICSFEQTRISTDHNLETIHEHAEPHPGRRVRISSGYAVGSGPIGQDDYSGRSISPLSLSDSSSALEEDEYHLEDINGGNRIGQRMKRQASAELDARPSKANIVSILNTVKPAKTRKCDKFSFPFQLRRLDAGKEKGKGKALAP